MQTAEEPGELDFIPPDVRRKLDLVRLKLHLADWRGLSLEERRELVDLPVEAPGELMRFGRELIRMAHEHGFELSLVDGPPRERQETASP